MRFTESQSIPQENEATRFRVMGHWSVYVIDLFLMSLFWKKKKPTVFPSCTHFAN